jgi:hypothetical protein
MCFFFNFSNKFKRAQRIFLYSVFYHNGGEHVLNQNSMDAIFPHVQYNERADESPSAVNRLFFEQQKKMNSNEGLILTDFYKFTYALRLSYRFHVFILL